MSQEATTEYNPEVTLEKIENEWIAKAIVFHNGNMVEAAKKLNISRAKLYRRCHKLGQDIEAQSGVINVG